MDFHVIAHSSGCSGGNCPTTYGTDRGTVLVQGNVVTDPDVLARMDIPAGETVVEVPAQLLADHARKATS